MPPAASRPEGAPGEAAQRPAGGGRRCPAPGLSLSSLHPSAPDGEETGAARQGSRRRRHWHCHRPAPPAGSAPGGSAPAGLGPPPRPGSPGPLLQTKGRRNSARTGRRTGRVGGSVLPQGGGAAARAGRGRGLRPAILPKEAAGLFLFPSPGESPAAPSRLSGGMAAGRPAGLGAVP